MHLHRPRERSSTTAANPPSTLSKLLERFATRSSATTRHLVAKRGGSNVLEGFAAIRSFGYRLEPRYIFRAGRLDQ